MGAGMSAVAVDRGRRDTQSQIDAGRPVRVVIRRRRVLSVVLSGAAICTALGLIPAMRGLWWAAGVLAVMAAGYLALVARVSHLQVRRQMARAFGRIDMAGELDWQELGRELDLAGRADDRDPFVAPVELDNRALGRFLLAFALGWALTPLVLLIRLVRGDVSVVQRRGVIDRLVRLQQYGRSQSLRLLTVGAAATVGITAVSSGGATAFAGPSMTASAAPFPSSIATTGSVLAAAAASTAASSTYAVRAGDTLTAIATRQHTTVAALVAANHLANPNLILVGQVLTVAAGATPAAGPNPTTTYSVRAGDTLTAIATRQHTTVAALVEANHIADPNMIHVGQLLTLAGSAAPAGAATVAGSAAGPVAAPAVKPPAPAPVPAPPALSPNAIAGAAGLPLPAQFLRGGTVDQGVDYAAPGGTPLYAMGPGVIIREGMNGFGPGTPVLQITAGPLAGKTVYYGHAGPDLVPVGAHVVGGQQISSVGYGIVGFSTGPHLEVGFYPPGGNGSGQAMLNYLNGVVGHSTHG